MRPQVTFSGLFFATLLGCSQNSVTISQRTFQQPGKMATVCVLVADKTPLPMADCRQTTRTDVALFAVATQSTRGEVGAVNLASRQVVDIDRRVPGFTFVSVGAVPTGIAISQITPECTYVATSDANIWPVPTSHFLRARVDGEAPTVPQPLPSRPASIVISPDDNAIIVSLPEAGSLVRMNRLPGCTLGPPQELRLSDVIPALRVADVDGAQRVCPLNSPQVAPGSIEPLPAASSQGVAPFPTDMALDPNHVLRTADAGCAQFSDFAIAGATAGSEACIVASSRGVVWVADETLPIVHRVDPVSWTELDPVRVDAPIVDVAVTPFVGPSDDAKRFLYGIDDNGLVLALDVSDQRDANFGGIVPVDLTARNAARLPLSRFARALEVVTRDVSAGRCDPMTGTSNIVAPNYLRGTFLTVATSEGALRVVDVDDFDARCRGRATGARFGEDCSAADVANDDVVYARTHRPRIGSLMTSGASITNTFLRLDQTEFTVAANGTGPEGATVPELALLTCPVGTQTLFPTDDSGSRICAVSELGNLLGEVYGASWEGTLPTAVGGAVAEPQSTQIQFALSFDPCASGVVGVEDVTASALAETEPEFAYRGDALAITTIMPQATLDTSAICRAVYGVLGASEQPKTSVVFPILRARRVIAGGQVDVALDAPLLYRSPFDGRALTVADALECFPQAPLRVEFRAQEAFVVVGNRTVARHRVVADSAGHCRINSALTRTSQLRAQLDKVFFNGVVAFQPTWSRPRVAQQSSLSLRFQLNGAPRFLAADVGFYPNTRGRTLTLSTAVYHSPENDRLYVLESESRGLVELTLAPFGVATSLQ